MCRKLSQEEVISEMQKLEPKYDFGKFTYTLSKNKSIIICDKGHQFEMSYNKFMCGRRCKICSFKEMGKRYRKNKEEVISIMKNIRPTYDFSSFVYVSYNIKSIVICDKGHQYKTTFRNIKEGKGCPYCAGKNKTKEIVIKELQTLGPNYDFSRFIYTKSIKKSTIICNKGHEYQGSYSIFKDGHRCPVCKIDILREKFIYSQEYVIEEMNKLQPNYDYSKFIYKKYNAKSNIICDKGHEFQRSFNSFINISHNCPICTNIKSKAEYEIINTINNLCDLKIVHGDRKTIPSPISKCRYLEIDIYIPDLKLAFEYNGTYWHSDEMINKRCKGYFKTSK